MSPRLDSMDSNKRLIDSVCLVTGAASGIGLAIAKALAAEGATVYGLDLNISSSFASAVKFLQADVTNLESLQQVLNIISRDHGRLDVLVTAAGVWRSGTVISDDAITAWTEVLNVNLFGTFLSSHVFTPLMMSNSQGSIVHIASISGLIGNRGGSAYSASKGAVISLTKSMALDFGSFGIRVNCICPGIVNTPMLAATESTLSPSEIHAVRSERKSKIPIGRIGEPSDVASTVVFLATSESSWTTGSVFVIDGGYLAGR